MAPLTDDLPFAEIEKLYPNHWLLLSPYKVDLKKGEYVRGTVLMATVNRDDLRFNMKELGLHDVAVACTKPHDPTKNFA